VALVAETGDLGWRPLGSLAGMGLSGVVLYALRRAGSLLGAARRDGRGKHGHVPLVFLLLLRSNGSDDFTHLVTCKILCLYKIFDTHN
jgi:hypothetical protein